MRRDSKQTRHVALTRAVTLAYASCHPDVSPGKTAGNTRAFGAPRCGTAVAVPGARSLCENARRGVIDEANVPDIEDRRCERAAGTRGGVPRVPRAGPQAPGRARAARRRHDRSHRHG